MFASILLSIKVIKSYDSLPKLNTSNHANYKEYYQGDQQLIDLVQEVFAKDFEMLGYSKEI